MLDSAKQMCHNLERCVSSTSNTSVVLNDYFLQAAFHTASAAKSKNCEVLRKEVESTNTSLRLTKVRSPVSAVYVFAAAAQNPSMCV